MRALLTAFIFTLHTCCGGFAVAQTRVVEGNVFPGIKYEANMIKNGDFEAANKIGVTDSSGIASHSTATCPDGSKGCLSINATASAQIVYIEGRVTEDTRNNNCEATFRYNGDASLYKAYVVDEGLNKISAEYTLTSSIGVTSSPDKMYFPCSSAAGDFIHVAIESTGDGAAIKVDKFLARLSEGSSVRQSSASTSYTPVTGGFGTLGTTNCTYSQAAPNLIIHCTFTNGTPTAATASVGLPSGFTVWSGLTTKARVGSYQTNTVAIDPISQPVFAVANGTGVTFGYQDSGSDGYSDRFGNAITTNGSIFSFHAIVPVNELQAAAQTFTAATSAISWSGYHSNDCSFARTNTAYGDPAADASCTFTSRPSTNFPTVSSYLNGGNPGPGITFTPPRIGKIRICAVPKIQTATSGAGFYARLTDGTTAFAQTSGFFSSGTGTQNPRICGHYPIISMASHTFRLETAASSGAVTIVATPTALTGDTSIEWMVEYIDVSLPAAHIKQGVVTAGDPVKLIANANLNCDAASAISSQEGTWVSSIGNISTGACTVTLSAGAFSSTPYCYAQKTDTGANNYIRSVVASSSTSVTVTCEDDASGSCATIDFNLHCEGPK